MIDVNILKFVKLFEIFIVKEVDEVRFYFEIYVLVGG